MSQTIDLKVEYTNRLAQENEALKARAEQSERKIKTIIANLGVDSYDEAIDEIDLLRVSAGHGLELKEQIERLKNHADNAQGWYKGEPLKAILAETAKAAFVAGYELCQSAQPLPALYHHNVHGFAEKYALDKAMEI